MSRWLQKTAYLIRYAAQLDRRLDEIRICQGQILAELNRSKRSADLCDYEFKVFSQWGEDGILQHLIDTVEIENRTFIEFGVEDFFESNCRYLLMSGGWKGFVIDGSRRNVDRLRKSYFYWRYPLDCRCAFVTKENVNSLLEEANFGKRLGILSVDVDGVDWHILRQLREWQPSIVVVEYNAMFGANRAVTVPYHERFVRSKAHWSHLYYGASLRAFSMLLNERGYALVGANSAGSNAFFIRRDLLNDRVRECDVSCFRESSFREGRDQCGRLLLQSARKSAATFAHLPLIDVETGRQITVGDVLGS
jgi:hypothetical protein